MAKRLIILFVIVASLGMYELAFLGKDMIKILELLGIGVIALIILLQLVYSKGENFKTNFGWEILLVFVGVILSMFTAFSGHNQGFTTTLIAQRFMYFYFFYFALHFIRISDVDLEKIIVYLAITYVVFYLLQFVAYPTVIFDVRTAEERGTVRIFLQGLSYLVLAYFYILNKLFERFTPGRLALLFLFFSIFILMGTRQIILTMFMLTVLNVLFSKKIKSKVMIMFLVIVSAIPVVFIFQDIFLSILSVTQEQSEGFEDDIRIRAATFFLYELFPNKISYITGNGAPSLNSPYGQLIQMYMDVFRFYQSDVGIVGDYSKFGAFFVIAVLTILIRVLTMKISSEFSYLKYYYFSIVLTMFTGGGTFGEGSSIVLICITLYIIDIDKHNRKLLEEDDDFVEEPESIAG
ncbi:MAG: hypothetical protein CVT94_14305 [Bacteroidetes bacterium HGW-Bacteroidetes-11]|jgi:hypothetical protein|nr:MAG: hypothetical protein CVT94_14305 [Bacteroidetes bacterium HGW-Bacteroidetes-11]